MANNCKHTICAVCGGTRLKFNFIGRTVNELCSPKCLTASKDKCECKCGGKFHQGRGYINKYLTPIKAAKSKAAKPKATKQPKIKRVFSPYTLADYIAEFMEGKRIKTTSFDRYSDKNLRKDNRKIALNFLSKDKGQSLDTLANDFLSENYFNQYDEQDIISEIVNYVNEYPSGIKSYIRDLEPDGFRLTEVVEEKKPKGQTKLQNFAYDKEGNIIFGTMKKRNGTHTDKKSHNVSIKISGFSKRIAGMFDTSIIEDIDGLKKEYFRLAKIYHPDAGGTNEQFQVLQQEYEQHLNTLLSGSKLTAEQQKNELELDKALRDAASALTGLPGIEIELVGKWLWVSGNTFPIKAQLSAAGFTWAPVKKLWYYKGTESRGRGNLSIEEIKLKYGSKKFNPPPPGKELNGIGNVKLSRVLKSKFAAAIKRAAKALNKRIV